MFPCLSSRYIIKDSGKTLEKIEVSSKIVPYTDPEDFWKMTRSEVAGYKMFVQTDNKGEWSIFQEDMTVT